jgi:adenylate cyclase
MQGMAELYKFTRESTVRTRELMQRAHEADPQWNRPVGGLAWSYWWEARMGWTDDREAWIRKGIELAERAIEMDPNDTLGYMQLGNDYQANWGLGTVLYRAGQTDRAVEVLKHAERLSPRHPASLSWALAEAQLLAGHYEDAIETARRASARVSNRAVPHVQLTAAYTALGRMEEARGEVAEVLRVDPKFTVSAWKGQNADYKDRAAVDKLASLLLKAGLPE